MLTVGPGPGIAPFRAFLEERQAIEVRGRNWLFFGEQRSASDFYYRQQLESMREQSHLTHLDTVFSRDQREKIYVRHRTLEVGANLWSWIQAGAHFYVCGDTNRMAKDVDAALHQIALARGGLSPDDATDYFNALKEERRYQRDVYQER